MASTASPTTTTTAAPQSSIASSRVGPQDDLQDVADLVASRRPDQRHAGRLGNKGTFKITTGTLSASNDKIEGSYSLVGTDGSTYQSGTFVLTKRL